MGLETMIRVVVDDPSQVGSARRAVTSLARSARLGDDAVGRAATVTTELATNLLKHADPGGEVLARTDGPAGTPGVEVLSLDRGPGSDRPDAWLVDGFTTAGSAGTGLGAVERAAQRFDVFSRAGEGTVSLARIGDRLPGAARVVGGAVEVGGVSVPIDGEEENGDGWAWRTIDGDTAIVVSDGLGHGAEAARASAAAIATFEAEPLDDLPRVLAEMDRSLHSTRGAAVAIAVIDAARGELRYAGIGNVSGAIVDGAVQRNLVSHNGTVGQGAPRAHELRYPIGHGSLVILHTDGIRAHWSLGAYPGLGRRPPTLVGAVLFRDHRRGRDDATVVVARVR